MSYANRILYTVDGMNYILYIRSAAYMMYKDRTKNIMLLWMSGIYDDIRDV